MFQRLHRLIMNWLGFSRTEANGFIILLPLMIILIFSEPVYRSWRSNQPVDFSEDKKFLDSLVANHRESVRKTKDSVQTAKYSFERFAFNPNKVSEKDLQRLGFSKHLSMRIVNYREKGGVFRVKRDLMKIYGMDSTLNHLLYNYIALPDELELKPKTDERKYGNKKEFITFDINKADTAQLKTIYGIGPALASRILKFRDGLGGFVSKAQVAEVYGLDSAVVNRLNKASYIEGEFQPRKLNVNTTDEKTLASHPYIRKSWAKAILAYRFQHGTFTSVEDLRKIAVIPPPEAERIIPYLKVTD
jgi:competence protein ComEA